MAKLIVGVIASLTLIAGCTGRSVSVDAPPTAAPVPAGSSSSPAAQQACVTRDSYGLGLTSCSCTASPGSGAPTFTGDACNETPAWNRDALCCAPSGYPISGGTCSCTYTTSRSWSCVSLGGGDECMCGFSGAFGDSSCGASAGGAGDVCCREGDGCTCYKGYSGCGTGATEVSSCESPAAAGIATPPSTCPSKTTKVPSCSQGV